LLAPKVVLAALLLAALFVLTVALGNWQLRRADEKALLASQRERALATPAVSIGAEPVAPNSLDGQRVLVNGVFESDRSVLLDNRTYRGRAGFHVLTPLKIDGNPERLMVLRGWLERDPRGADVAPRIATPAGAVTIQGFAQAKLPQSIILGREKTPSAGDRIWQSFDLQRYATWSGIPIQPLLVRQYSNLDDGLIRDWPIVGSGIDKHRGYAVQWYLMAVTILVIAAVLMGRLWRSRHTE
jgi:surfeit locus 1 family protein